jgi:hypothetical protein
MINSVRNTVLSVLNKNNYGYISPSDFNLFAKQAQLEVFEEYFSEYNKTITEQNLRSSGSDYADGLKPIEEAMELFVVSSTLTQQTPNTSRYFMPSPTTTGYDYYKIIRVMCYDASVTPKVFNGEAEKVNHNRISQLTTSNLTSPTRQWPSYTQEGSVMTLYPSTINRANEVEAVYFRYPKDPKWTYITVMNGEPVFDQSQGDYQDFEVPIEDEYKLVSKILQYAGMSIREVMAVQFGAAEEQKQSQ